MYFRNVDYSFVVFMIVFSVPFEFNSANSVVGLLFAALHFSAPNKIKIKVNKLVFILLARKHVKISSTFLFILPNGAFVMVVNYPPAGCVLSQTLPILTFNIISSN